MLPLMDTLAMADVFLIAFFRVISTGAGYVTLQTAGGQDLLTASILPNLTLSHLANPLKPSEIEGKTGA